MKGLKKELAGKLKGEEIEKLKKSFDVVGDVAILEIPEGLAGKAKLIAEAVVRVHPHIKTVLRKAGPRKGKLRLRDLETVLGRETETIHREHGCRFKLDVKKVYFSPREATERLRIAKKVKPGERFLVMFSGVGPFGIVAAKAQPDCRVVCVELNKDAVKYADENVRLNQLTYRVENVRGDVRKVCPGLGKFDRISLHLPEEAWEYLDTALECSRKGTLIHLYGISGEEGFRDLVEKAMGMARKSGKKLDVLEKRKVLPFGIRLWKVCLDLRVR